MTRTCPDCNSPCLCVDHPVDDLASLRARLMSYRPRIAAKVDELNDTFLAQLRLAILADYRDQRHLGQLYAAHHQTALGDAAAYHGAGNHIATTARGKRINGKVASRVAKELTATEREKQLKDEIAERWLEIR